MIREMLFKLAIKFAINRLEKEYGPPCDTKDTEDFPDIPKELNGHSRCIVCQAHEVIEWLKDA